jgi:hypothetical protein
MIHNISFTMDGLEDFFCRTMTREHSKKVDRLEKLPEADTAGLEMNR